MKIWREAVIKGDNSGPRMKISGVVVFEDLKEAELELAHEFRCSHSELQFEFEGTNATVRWKCFQEFASLIRLAASLAVLKTL
jgi:hypothetical protein